MNDQAANLRREIEMQRSLRQAKTIAIVSGKGGVGKSNFALNFSLSLANKGKKVLIFDLDIGMGNIDILLGLTPRYSIVKLFEEELSIYDIIEKGPNSVSYIAAGSGLTEIFTMDETKFHFFLSQLKELLATYDYIFFDMGAGVTTGSFFYMLAADECIVITTPEPTALTDAYGMIKHLTLENSSLPILLLVNRAGSQKEGLKTINRLETVVKQFLEKEIIALGVLPEDRAVLQAVSAQKPFMLHTPTAAVTIAMNQITTQYLNNSFDVRQKVSYSFLTRLKMFIKER